MALPSMACPGACLNLPRISLALIDPKFSHKRVQKQVHYRRPESNQQSRDSNGNDAVFREISLGDAIPGSLLRPIALVPVDADGTRLAGTGDSCNGTSYGATQNSNKNSTAREGGRSMCGMDVVPGVITVKPMCVALSERDDNNPSGIGKNGGNGVRGGSDVHVERISDVLLRSDNTGSRAPPVDPVTLKKQRRIRRKEQQRQYLEKWGNMPLKEMSPTLLRELRVLQLRRYADGKTFSKDAGIQLLPSRTSNNGSKKNTGNTNIQDLSSGASAYLQVCRMVGGGLPGVGAGKESQASGTSNRPKRRRGKEQSLLRSMLKSEVVQQWTRRKYREIQHEKQLPGQRGWNVDRKKRRKF